MRFKFTLCFSMIAALLCVASVATQDNPKQEKFGSSLKRLKWDKKTETAVESKPANEKSKVERSASDTVRIETVLAVFDVLVIDRKGAPISGLTKKDFTVVEDGIEQEIGTLTLGSDKAKPRSIILIFDYSGSLSPYINDSVEAAKALIDQLNPADKMAIVTDNVELLQGFTSDKSTLKKKLDELKKRVALNLLSGKSLQYSALLATLRELVSNEDRSLIIFQTDGDQLFLLHPHRQKARGRELSPANFSLADVQRAVQRSQTTIYTVMPGLQLLGRSQEEQSRKAQIILDQRMEFLLRSGLAIEGVTPSPSLSEIKDNVLQFQTALFTVSESSGGWIDFLESPNQANAIYGRILKDINDRYIIGYYPTNTARDGKLRKVKIEIRDHPEYVVWAKKSYYALEPDN